MADRELSDQEKAFVLAYLGEARQHKKLAATLAGYSARSAHVAATRLLKRPRIKQALSKKRLKLERDLAISVDRVAQELAWIGFMDVRRLFNEDGRLKPIDELDADTAAAISSLKVSREKTTVSNGGEIRTVVEEAIIEVKLCPKVEALIALARTLRHVRGQGQGPWARHARAARGRVHEARHGGVSRSQPAPSLGRTETLQTAGSAI